MLAHACTIFPLGLLLAAAHRDARGDVKREAARVPIMRLAAEGRSGSWRQDKQLAVIPPGALADIFDGESQGDRPFEYFASVAERRNPFTNKDDLRRIRERHFKVSLDWRTCVPEITLYQALRRLDSTLPGQGFGLAADAIIERSPSLLSFLDR